MSIPINPDISDLVELRDALNKSIRICEGLQEKFRVTQDKIKKLGLTEKQIEGLERLLFED